MGISNLSAKNTAWVYDIECFANFFSATFENLISSEIKVFYIYKDRNDFKPLIRFLHSNIVEYLISFNGLSYDDKMLGYMIEHCKLLAKYDSNTITHILCQATNYLINNSTDFKPKYCTWYNRIDLFSLLGGKRANLSLKKCAINMGMANIQDLPFPPNSIIEDENIELILRYNKLDVAITKALFFKEEKEIKLREFMMDKYHLDLYNADRTYLGKLIFIDKFNSKVPTEYQISFDNLKKWKTKRTSILLKDVIDARWQFKTPEFQKILTDLSNITIDIVNGKFRWKDPVKNKYVEFKYKTVIDGLPITIGCGGIHSNEKKIDIFPDSDHFLVENDFASYYPNLICSMLAIPEHFRNVAAQFIETIREIIQDRMYFKNHPDKTDENKLNAEGMKIAVNALFGLMGSIYFAFYDLKAILKTTINGQLGLLKGIEESLINKLKVLSCNTDGYVILGKNELKSKNTEIVQELEKLIECDCDISPFERMINKDVNNYIWVKSGNNVKQKGAFLPLKERRLDQSVNHPIVMDALNNYFLQNASISSTINACTDITYFTMSQKLGIEKSSNLPYQLWTVNSTGTPVSKQQKTTRFYCSTEGNYLKRVGRNTSAFIIKDQYVTVFNNFIEKPFEDYKVDKTFYINLAEKLSANYKTISNYVWE